MTISFKKLLWHWRGIWLIATAVTSAVLGLRFIGLLQSTELSALDGLLQLQPKTALDSRIVIVGITEQDLRNQGKWPLPDASLAKLITIIKQQQPRVIGLDIYRDLPVEPGHKELVAVMKSTPNLIGIEKVIGGKGGPAVNPAPVLKELGQVSMNDLIVDADGKSRRSLLSLEDKEGNVILGLGPELALRYLEKEGITLDAVDLDQNILKLGKAQFTSLRPSDGGYVGNDAGGYQILMLSALRNLGQKFPMISLTEVLTGKLPPDLMRDRIVLIGVTADSAGDLFFVPYKREILSSAPTTVSGVEIHADIANQLLTAAIKGRPQLHTWPKLWESIWIALWALLGVVIPWWGYYQRIQLQSSSVAKKRWVTISLSPYTLIGFGVGLVGAAYLALMYGWWIPVMPPLLSMTGAATAVTVYLARSASTMRQTFGRYLTDEVVANLLENPQSLKLGGEKRQVTLMVSDLRGFSAISGRLSPEEAVEVINHYLEAMTAVINHYGGTINDFIGDGIFTIFGAPLQESNDAERAVACAIAMQKAMQPINARNREEHLPLLEMGIGLHTGEVLAGNIGSAKRAKYTVMGSEVNLAFRIESYTVGGQILASAPVLQACKTPIYIDQEVSVQLKGFQDAIALYEIKGIGGTYDQFLEEQVEAMVTLSEVIVVRYQILQNKSLLETTFEGKLLKLSNNQAEMVSPHTLTLLENLKLNLLIYDKPTSEDVYAKVVEQVSENHYRIRFTSVPPAIAEILAELQQAAQSEINQK